jgi:hypothetical protein
MDTLVVKEHCHHKDGTVTANLRRYDDPPTRFYVTKPGLRNHDEKKEWEKIDRLDEYIVPHSRVTEEVFRALHGYFPRGRVSLRNLSESPYLYGTDISIEAVAKDGYAQKWPEDVKPAALTTGMYDSESSMQDHDYGKLIMATVTHEHKVYTAIVKSSFFFIDDKGNRKPGNMDDLMKLVHEKLDPNVIFTDPKTRKRIVDGWPPFEYEVKVVDKPIDILKWIFGKIHQNKTDFVGVWNLPFDTRLILKTCEEAGIRPADLYCPPELDEDLKRFHFKEDPGKPKDHFSRRWHWPSVPGYTQWYDAMCLYSILRIVKGFESSYALDYVLRKNKISDGKLKFSDRIPEADSMSSADWHRLMQTKYPYEYIVYSIFDSVSIQAMERVNNDVTALYALMEQSPLHSFNKQTRRAADVLHFYTKSVGKIVAASSTANDPYGLTKKGGAVLSPEFGAAVGMPVVEELPNSTTSVALHVSDIDLSAIYPNNTMSCNISRETKVSLLRGIDGFPEDDIRMLASMLIAIKPNAVPIATHFFGLPDYAAMEQALKLDVP